MSIQKTIVFIIVFSITLLTLSACAYTSREKRNALKLSHDYQVIDEVSAYVDVENNLYLCVSFQTDDSVLAQTVMQIFTWKNNRVIQSPMLIPASNSGYLLDTKKVKTGCIIPDSAAPVKITRINVDNEIEKMDDLWIYVAHLPANETGLKLYFLTSDKFNITAKSCKNYPKNKKCFYNLFYVWPRLVMVSKRRIRNDKFPNDAITIAGGHSGEQRGHDSGATTKAVLSDIITFPFQAFGSIIYVVFGAK